MSFRWRDDRRPQASDAYRKALEAALADLLEYLLETSNRTCPIEESILIKSGGTSQDGLKGTVYYDTPYARKQHEATNFRHDPGRRAKYLELTLKEEEGNAGEFLASRMRKAV